MPRRRAADGFVADGDCYGVTWDGDTATVTHYPDHETRRACCKQTVTITDEDRTQAMDFETRKGSVAALKRVPDCRKLTGKK